MKRTILALLSSFIVSLFLISCQKEVSTELGTQTGGNNSGSGNKTSYNPTTVGSWWKYRDTASGTISTATMLKQTSTINGIVYTAMFGENATARDTGWAASPQPNYYLYEKGVSPNTGASYDLLFHYLNDTAGVGTSWHYTAGQGNGFTALIETTIVERNISMSVQGKIFSNVIHTRLVLSYNVYGQSLDGMAYDYFTARGIGIIKVRSEGLSLISGFNACSDLIDYSIK